MTMPTPTPMPMPTPTPMPMPAPWPHPRPRPHRMAFAGALCLGLSVTAVSLSRGAATQTRVNDDVRNVGAVLDAMRGTAPLPCALALSIVEGNGWNSWYGAGVPQDSTVERLQDWLREDPSDPAVVPALRAAMAPGDACVRQTAARLLGRIHHQRAVDALAEALRDPDATTREFAAVGLALSNAPGAYAPLTTGLKDAEPRVRMASALALGKLGDKRATTELVPLLQRDRSADVRRAAAIALGALD